MHTFSHIDTSGVLDMKFNPQCVGKDHVLAIALSDGYLSLQPLDIYSDAEHMWGSDERILVVDESTICLSVDWSNQMIADSDPLVAVSLSNGQMSICGHRDGSLEVLQKWNAHTLPYTTIPAEVWITSFDPQDKNTVFSGGDDGIMKLWDLRLQGTSSRPVATCSEFEAGVTSMCWNKGDPSYITVGSYDGHVRLFDKRNIGHAVSDYDVQNNAGIWRIKYKHNTNYYVDGAASATSGTKNELLLAAMRAGFIVMNYDADRRFNERVVYLEQGTESLAYGVDYVYKKGSDVDRLEGYVGSCSFYNHLMHVWSYDYHSCSVCLSTVLFAQHCQ